MKKILSLMLVMVMITIMTVGCSSSKGDSSSDATNATNATNEAKPGDGTTITWLSQGPGDDAWEGLTKDILAKYKEETGVTVKAEWYSFSDLFEVIEVKLGSNSSDYDLISVDVPMVAAYAKRGFLQPMDSYYTADEKSQFITSAIDAGSYDGKFYAPPMNTSSQLLWYNTALLEEAGITVPESDVENRLTWEQVTKIASDTLAVVDPDGTKGIAGIMFQQVSRTYQMNAIPNSLGEASIGDDGLTAEGIINSDGWVKACTWYQDLYNNKLALKGITADEVGNTFNAGKVLFMVGGTWSGPQADAAGFTTYGYCPVPTFEGYEDSVATPTGSWHFGMPKNSKNQQAAADFIKWMTIGEGNTLWLAKNGDVPSTLAGAKAITDDANASPIMKIAAYEAANTAVPRALTPGYTEYDTVINNMWEDIRNGSEVKSSLDNAVSQINTAFAKYK